MVMEFQDSDMIGSGRTGTLSNITAQEITEIFGFEPNVDDDPWKVVNSWCARMTGHNRAPGDGHLSTVVHVWDYKGSHEYNQFSCDGDSYYLRQIFGDRYSRD